MGKYRKQGPAVYGKRSKRWSGEEGVPGVLFDPPSFRRIPAETRRLHRVNSWCQQFPLEKPRRHAWQSPNQRNKIAQSLLVKQSPLTICSYRVTSSIKMSPTETRLYIVGRLLA